MEKTDILIIGGGIIGASAAYFLSKDGADVTIVERSEIGREASGATAGSMAIQNKELGVIPLTYEALKVWAQLQAELEEDLGFRQHGGLRIAESNEQLKVLRDSVHKQRRSGIEVEMDILSGHELRLFAPYLGPSVVAASFCKEDSRGNPLVAAPALARAAQQMGARVRVREEVKGITIHGNKGFLVKTALGAYRSSVILNCAGVWSKEIFRMMDVEVPITLDPQQCMITEQVPPIFPYIITHIQGNLTLKQLDDGNVLIGGGWKGIGDVSRHIKKVRCDSLIGNAQYACRGIPALADLAVMRCWTGLEGRSPDFLPLLGSLKHLPAFYAATCVKGGFTMGPVLGRLISELILSGKTSFPIKEFDINRVLK